MRANGILLNDILLYEQKAGLHFASAFTKLFVILKDIRYQRSINTLIA